MSKTKTQEKVNELYALHFRGVLMEPGIWKNYTDNYGATWLQGWRPPKKIYYKLHHAKNAIRHLPKEIQSEVQIIRYLPGEIVQ